MISLVIRLPALANIDNLTTMTTMTTMTTILWLSVAINGKSNTPLLLLSTRRMAKGEWQMMKIE